MGQIVAAMATMHAPQFFTRPPEEDPKQLDAGIAAMRKLGEVLDETKPDALLVFASDHLETFFLKSVPTFALNRGRTCERGVRRQDLVTAILLQAEQRRRQR
jgi:2,3-dihydroxyphenylpropionate 1,2-dioxygenase